MYYIKSREREYFSEFVPGVEIQPLVQEGGFAAEVRIEIGGCCHHARGARVSMCVCVRACAYVRVYIHTYVYTYIHTFTYIQTYICVCMHACMLCMHACMHACIHTCSFTYQPKLVQEAARWKGRVQWQEAQEFRKEASTLHHGREWAFVCECANDACGTVGICHRANFHNNFRERCRETRELSEGARSWYGAAGQGNKLVMISIAESVAQTLTGVRIRGHHPDWCGPKRHTVIVPDFHTFDVTSHQRCDQNHDPPTAPHRTRGHPTPLASLIGAGPQHSPQLDLPYCHTFAEV